MSAHRVDGGPCVCSTCEAPRGAPWARLEPPEPVSHCSPLELDDGSGRGTWGTRAILGGVALIALACVAWSCLMAGCASAVRVSRSYAVCSTACQRAECSRQARETACGWMRCLP